ncbi:alpha/beta hydrolase, partial [Nonomuraea sp. RK-328]|nr:alpha/beta hydrolase [Nonomuraea sp. RK-328]
MAADMVETMESLGFERFAVAGHDRGGRVGYRMALDHPGRVRGLAVLDVIPALAAWERADARLALAFGPWSLLAQPAPLPERIVLMCMPSVRSTAPARHSTESTTPPRAAGQRMACPVLVVLTEGPVKRTP